LKALIAATCAAVLGASGLYFYDQFRDYQIAKHETECKKLLKAGHSFAVMIRETSDPVWQRYLDRNAQDIVAEGCEQ
jgi:hypothetical protein